MYFSVFQSSEYNSDEDITNKDNDNDNICIICWFPENINDKIYLLSEIRHITLYCECNPKLHKNCLNNWLITTHSCPICRKKLIINFNLDNRYMILNVKIFIGRFIQVLFKIYFFILAMHLFIIFINIILSEAKLAKQIEENATKTENETDTEFIYKYYY